MTKPKRGIKCPVEGCGGTMVYAGIDGDLIASGGVARPVFTCTRCFHEEYGNGETVVRPSTKEERAKR